MTIETEAIIHGPITEPQQEEHTQDENTQNTQKLYGQSVVCELLCFAQHFLNCSAPNNVKNITVNFYTDDEIIAAKRVLWSENNKPFLAKYADRRNTNLRTGAEANIDDIFTALSALDKLEDVDKKTQYAAHNLSRLPSENPEDLNKVSMLQRLNALERRFKSLENNISENYIEFNGVQQRVESLS